MIFHKHLLVNAKVTNPITSEDDAITFLRDLVKRINMNILQGPFASYVNKKGNRGLTAIVMIETSHIAFHIWDEEDPGTLQFDLYTCGQLDVNEVLKTLTEKFITVSMDYQVYDRAVGFFLEQQGSL